MMTNFPKAVYNTTGSLSLDFDTFPPSFRHLQAQQLVQVEAAKVQEELAALTVEGYSSDETVPLHPLLPAQALPHGAALVLVELKNCQASFGASNYSCCRIWHASTEVTYRVHTMNGYQRLAVARYGNSTSGSVQKPR